MTMALTMYRSSSSCRSLGSVLKLYPSQLHDTISSAAYECMLATTMLLLNYSNSWLVIALCERAWAMLIRITGA